MGISKAMMEKVAVAKSRESNGTVINVTRYGNVMCSRGSVIPLFASQIQSGLPLTITDPSMTRFMMTLDEAVELVLFAFEHGRPGEIFVQKAPAATIQVLASALTELLGVPRHPVNVIGTRHGEKLFEVLLSREEMACAHDIGSYYRVPPDLRDLNYDKFIEHGEISISEALEYSSHNTTQLDVLRMRAMLMNLRYIKSILRGEHGEAEG
jgi:UDP-glucose 4-epimerase